MSTLDSWIFIAELVGLLVCIFILLCYFATFVGRCIEYGSYEQAAWNDGEDSSTDGGEGLLRFVAIGALVIAAFSGVAAQSGRDSSAPPQRAAKLDKLISESGISGGTEGGADSTAAVSERDGRRALQYRDGLRELGLSVNDPAKRASLSRSETCRNARKAVRYYWTRYVEWTRKRGASPVPRQTALSACPKWAVHVLRSKARAMRLRWERYWHWHYAWWDWLPDKWQRIGACETGYGRRPGDFHWNSGPYQGAFGFAVSSWDAFRLPGYPSEAYLATPRQQYEVALAIWRRYGFSGWGCASA